MILFFKTDTVKQLMKDQTYEWSPTSRTPPHTHTPPQTHTPSHLSQLFFPLNLPLHICNSHVSGPNYKMYEQDTKEGYPSLIGLLASVDIKQKYSFFTEEGHLFSSAFYLLSLQKVALSCDFVPHSQWNIRMGFTTALLNAEPFWWWHCSVRYSAPLPQAVNPCWE